MNFIKVFKCPYEYDNDCAIGIDVRDRTECIFSPIKQKDGRSACSIEIDLDYFNTGNEIISTLKDYFDFDIEGRTF